MNNEQRKFLKSRIAALSFSSWCCESDTTPSITLLRKEFKRIKEKICVFESKVSKIRELECEKLKSLRNSTNEVVYGKDYDKALQAVKNLEIRYAIAKAKNYGVFSKE